MRNSMRKKKEEKSKAAELKLASDKRGATNEQPALTADFTADPKRGISSVCWAFF